MNLACSTIEVVRHKGVRILERLRQCDRPFEARIVPVRHSKLQASLAARETSCHNGINIAYELPLLLKREGLPERRLGLYGTQKRCFLFHRGLFHHIQRFGCSIRRRRDNGIRRNHGKIDGNGEVEEMTKSCLMIWHDAKVGSEWANELFICFCPTADSTIGGKLNWYCTGGQVG